MPAPPTGIDFVEIKAEDTGAYRGAVRPARLHLPRPAPQQAGHAVVGGRRPRHPQRAARPGPVAASGGGGVRRARRDRRPWPGRTSWAPAGLSADVRDRGRPARRSPPPTGPRSSCAEPSADTPAGWPSSSTAKRRDRVADHRSRPRQPGPAVAGLRRGDPVLHQRSGPDGRAGHRGRRAAGAGPQPGDADRRRRDPAAAQRGAAGAGRGGPAPAHRVRLHRVVALARSRP